MHIHRFSTASIRIFMKSTPIDRFQLAEFDGVSHFPVQTSEKGKNNKKTKTEDAVKASVKLQTASKLYNFSMKTTSTKIEFLDWDMRLGANGSQIRNQ